MFANVKKTKADSTRKNIGKCNEVFITLLRPDQLRQKLLDSFFTESKIASENMEHIYNNNWWKI